jgi:hypothetical protein
LKSLSQRSHSVPAIQVLTIGAFEGASFESSLRSFMRHVTGARNEIMKETELEKKRKRREVSLASSHQPRAAKFMADGIRSPPKRSRIEEFGSVVGRDDKGDGKLPKSIESLYKSIMSAQEELEAGRSWSEDASTEV